MGVGTLGTDAGGLVDDRLTLSRQLGVQVSGDLLGKRLSYAVGAFNGNRVNNNFNDNDQFLYAGRVTAVVAEAPRTTVIDGETVS